jgi:IS30 family transposase
MKTPMYAQLTAAEGHTIWADKRAGGRLPTHLRGARKRFRKRYGYYDRRGRLAGKRLITERPAIVNARGRIGDWKADTILERRMIPTVC